MDFIIRLLKLVPVLNWFVNDAINGSVTCKVCFILNLGMAWLLAIYVFGYPAIIIPALTLVPLVFITLISITAQDCFPKTKKG